MKYLATLLLLLLLLLLLEIKYLIFINQSKNCLWLNNTKISEIEIKIAIDHDHDKYIVTQEFNRLTSEKFTARLKQANLASKSDIANFIKKTNF